MAYLRKDAIMITNSADYTIKEVKDIVSDFLKNNPDNKGLHSRNEVSYVNEWAVHALCYLWGIMKSRAKDAKLEYNIEPEVKIIYNIAGPVCRLFLKFYKK